MKGCPLDKEYKNTIYFEDIASQTNYFTYPSNFVYGFKTLNNYTYVRKSNTLRVACAPDTLTGYNYMAFKNTGFGTKMFYAFIEDISFVNTETTEISFSIDVMQTWFFDYTLLESYVERQHAIRDDFGRNNVDENLDLGEIFYNPIRDVTITDTGSDHYTLGNLYDPTIVVVAASESVPVVGPTVENRGFHQNVYSGLYYTWATTVSAVNSIIDAYTNAGASDAIVSIFQCPDFLIKQHFPEVLVEFPHTINDVSFKYYASETSYYSPKNAKLLGSPYRHIYVTNHEGSAALFEPEKFMDLYNDNDMIEFRTFGTLNCNPTILLYPIAYKGGANYDNYNDALTLQNYPQCDYNIDLYKSYIAQNANKLENTLVQASIKADYKQRKTLTDYGVELMRIPSLTPSGIANDIVSLGTYPTRLNQSLESIKIDYDAIVAEQNAMLKDIDILPPQSRSNYTSSPLVASGNKGFVFYEASITAEFAKKIDAYFEHYGYAQKQMMQPYRKARKYWTYVKILDPNMVTTRTVAGDLFTSGTQIPAADNALIRKIYQTGITFWTIPNGVGNYDLTNTPLGANAEV